MQKMLSGTGATAKTLSPEKRSICIYIVTELPPGRHAQSTVMDHSTGSTIPSSSQARLGPVAAGPATSSWPPSKVSSPPLLGIVVAVGLDMFDTR